MSTCVKFGLDRPSHLAGHTEHRYRQTDKHNAFYYIDGQYNIMSQERPQQGDPGPTAFLQHHSPVACITKLSPQAQVYGRSTLGGQQETVTKDVKQIMKAGQDTGHSQSQYL